MILSACGYSRPKLVFQVFVLHCHVYGELRAHKLGLFCLLYGWSYVALSAAYGSAQFSLYLPSL